MRSIVLCGFSGCGKTTVARLLASRMGLRFVDTDALLRRLAGRSARDMLENGEEALMRDWEHRACIEASRMDNCVVSTGGGAMTYRRNSDLFRGRAFVVYVTRAFALIYPDVSRDPTRPLVYRRTEDEVAALLAERDPLYRACADLVVSNDSSPLACAEEIARAYRSARPRRPAPPQP